MFNFFIFILIFIISIFNKYIEACEQVCFYGNGDGNGYCDYWCKSDSGGHNSASDYAYNFASALRRNGFDCSVVGSAESSVHCNNMYGCKGHSWYAGNDCP